MLEFSTLRPDQIAEARRVIYTVAHKHFNEQDPLEETIVRYQTTWPLRDLDNFQQEYIENGGTFLVLCEDGRIIGTGALRRLDDTTGEIKRVWLLPEHHGQGLGYQIMTHLLDAACEKGYTRVRLETSPAYQQRAFAFYRKLGFYEIPRYGDDPDDVGMEMLLE